MISNPRTEEREGQLVRNPVLLIREECSAFHLDAERVAVLALPLRAEPMSRFCSVGHSCAPFKKNILENVVVIKQNHR